MPNPLWIFGYGSLCWKSDFPSETQFVGSVHGWGRFFAQRSADHRGTPEAPGLVATLLKDVELEALGIRSASEPPSRTCGVCYLVGEKDVKAVLDALDFREKGGYTREIIEVFPQQLPTAGVAEPPQPVRALLYSATSENPGFDPDALHDVHACSCNHWCCARPIWPQSRVLGAACSLAPRSGRAGRARRAAHEPFARSAMTHGAPRAMAKDTIGRSVGSRGVTISRAADKAGGCAWPTRAA